MYLVQLLLPLYDNHGQAFGHEHYLQIRTELVERFGGLTAYTRAPASGLWQQADDQTPVRDDLVIYEIMTEQLDTAWWQEYRQALERRFKQDSLIIRAQQISML